jgi:hypothetical protein
MTPPYVGKHLHFIHVNVNPVWLRIRKAAGVPGAHKFERRCAETTSRSKRSVEYCAVPVDIDVLQASLADIRTLAARSGGGSDSEQIRGCPIAMLLQAQEDIEGRGAASDAISDTKPSGGYESDESSADLTSVEAHSTDAVPHHRREE